MRSWVPAVLHMAKQRCPLCGKRRARRACPALGQQICAVCCGTKRETEISCPPDCTYLHSASTHPPAVVQRRQERDIRFLLPLLQGLTDRQQQILLLLQAFLRSDRPDAPAVADADVEQAAEALAQTYETASRGIVYEHQAAALSAQRLATDLKAVIDATQAEGAHMPDSDLGIALRRIETGAREARRALDDDGSETAYLSMLKRVFPNDRRLAGSAAGGDDAAGTDPRSSLIVPGR